MWFIKLGSTIRGPYSEDQLKDMLARGEFSRLHLVSSDRQKWESAGSLVSLIENRIAPRSQARTPEAAPVAAEKVWFFSKGGSKEGPFDKEQMMKLVADGSIGSGTMLFGPNLTEWTSASRVPEFRSCFPHKKMNTLLIGSIAGGAVLFLGVILTFIYAFSRTKYGDQELAISGKVPADSEGDGGQFKSGAIRNVSDEATITQAIGRVQIIKRFSMPNGSVVEKPAGHGSAFCVTESGYFITNRHVVEDFSPEFQDEEFVEGVEVKLPRTMAILLFLNKLRFEAKLIYMSNRFDLAIIKIERGKAMPFFRLKRDPSATRGTEVIALGFPGVAGIADEEENAAISARIVSEFKKALEVKRQVPVEVSLTESSFSYSLKRGPVDMVTKDAKGILVYHDAKIHGGNSGGPIVLESGTVLAINTAIKRDLTVKELTLEDGSKGVMAINDGNLNIAYLVGQFESEINEYVPNVFWE